MLLLMALLMTDPVVVMSVDGGFAVHFADDPAKLPLNQPVTVRFRIVDPATGDVALDHGEVRFDARMPQHRHGMNVRPVVVHEGQGNYRVSPVLLHMPGRWFLYVDIKRAGVIERAQHVIELQP